MARRRGGAKPIIAAILRQIDAFLKEIHPDEETGAVPDLDFVWEWISPNGQVRREVTRNEFEGGTGSAEGWPLPGTYRVTIVDSNGDPDPRFDPWEAEHVDKDSLAGPNPDHGSGGVMGALHGLAEEYRCILRDKKIEVSEAKRHEREAEIERRRAEQQLADAQREMAAHKLAAERAIADKDYAEAKQKEAEDAYRELDRSINAFEPQFKAGVDRVIERVLGPFIPVAPADNDDGEPPSQERPVWAAGDDTPERAKAEVDDVLRTVIENIDTVRPLVESGKLQWETVRYIAYKIYGHDIGPDIDWSAWEGEEVSDAG